jgi:hypothetical protein
MSLPSNGDSTPSVSSRRTPLASRASLRVALFVAIAAGLAVTVAIESLRADGPAAPCAPALAPLDFGTPEAAAAAFFDALERNDDARVGALLGSKGADLVRDGKDDAVVRRRHAYAAAAKEKLEFDRTREADGVLVMLVGSQGHPAAIPLVKGSAGWHLDADAGRERMHARRVGRNELAAIALCRTVVEAEAAYASAARSGDDVLEYARRVCATPGRRDGLCWDDRATPADPSPLAVALSALGAPADAQPSATPFGGYLWRVLTAQGPHATDGAKSYVVDGRLTGGFAVVAAPAAYRETGVKTFLIGRSGDLYEKDLGEDTLRVAGAIDAFDPDETWTRVEDGGDDDPEDGPPPAPAADHPAGQ